MDLEKNLVVNGSPLFYRVMGQGPTVMLVHGFAEDSRLWEPLADVLKSRYRILLPDLPGSRQSGPGNYDEWSMEYFAEGLHAVLNAELVESCVMIGHSMGGYITLAFAEKYPDRLRAFGLFHSTAYADSEEKKNTRRRGIAFIGDHGAEPFLEQSVPNLFSDGFKQAHEEAVDRFLDQVRYFSPASLIHYYEAMIKRPDRTAVLKHFPRPVLFLIGQRDKAVPFGDSLQQCHLPEFSYIHILENSAHYGMTEEKDKSLTAVEAFLSDIWMKKIED